MKPKLDFPVLVAAAAVGDETARDELSGFVYFYGASALRKMFPRLADELIWTAVGAVSEKILDLTLPRAWDASKGTWLSFLMAALRNAALDVMRADSRRRSAERSQPTYDIDEQQESDAPSPERHAEAREALALVWSNLSAVEQRIALALCQGLSAEDIAQREGMTPGALRAMVSRMRKRVWREYRNDGPLSSTQPMPMPDLRSEAQETCEAESPEEN